VRIIQSGAFAFLVIVAVVAATAYVLAPHNYAAQFREHIRESPTKSFPLGTDDLGRDRFSRLLVGTQISLLCALTASFLATGLGAAIGVLAGYSGGWFDEAAGAVIDLFLSLPWFFAMLSLKALLPLDIPASISIAATFLLLAIIGWAPGARVMRAGAAGLRNSPSILYARAYGCGGGRLLCFHILPSLKPILSAQFWTMVPVFLLAEANLGVLGLGISEPLPSLGNMLVDLQNYEQIPGQPWVLAPAFLLVLVVGSLHFVVSGRQKWEQG
jgi:ABC-type dipeptide/oligopeptide/nickel transport system permease subunit